MPHDASLPERRPPRFRLPVWTVALALTAVFVVAVVAIAVATGILILALPALIIVGVAYTVFYVIVSHRRRRYWGGAPSVVADSRAGRRFDRNAERGT